MSTVRCILLVEPRELAVSDGPNPERGFISFRLLARHPPT